MNFKRSTTSMAIAIMALSLISMTSIQQDVFGAKGLGMSITATADQGSDTIIVTGMTASDITDITFRVTSPSGNNVVAVWQVSPDENGEFMVKFKVGPTWTEDGLYEINAMQAVVSNALYSLDVLVEVIGGMTEETSTTQATLETDFDLLVETNVAQDAGLVLDKIIMENGSTMFEVTGKTDR